jgi:hypothetical protein
MDTALLNGLDDNPERAADHLFESVNQSAATIRHQCLEIFEENRTS